MSNIHPSAIVDAGAEIGADVTIGPFSFIDEDVEIGKGCVIGPHVSILRYTSLGRNCRVHAGVVIGDTPQDVSFEPCESRVIVGDGCRIREGVTIHRGTKPGTVTRVGDECFLMAFSHVAHNVRLGARVVLANGVLLAGYVEVDDGAFLSGNSMVHQFVRIGRLAMLGGGCGASKDVPPFVTLRPCSLNRVVGLNVVGLRRAGISAADRTNIKKAYRILYESGLNVAEAVEKIREGFSGGPALEFADFINHSKRGICAADHRTERAVEEGQQNKPDSEERTHE